MRLGNNKKSICNGNEKEAFFETGDDVTGRRQPIAASLEFCKCDVTACQLPIALLLSFFQFLLSNR